MALLGSDAPSSDLASVKAGNANRVKLDAEVETLRSPWQNTYFGRPLRDEPLMVLDAVEEERVGLLLKNE